MSLSSYSNLQPATTVYGERGQEAVYIQRSQSTSDLFQIPELVNHDRKKRRQNQRSGVGTATSTPQSTRHSSIRSVSSSNVASFRRMAVMNDQSIEGHVRLSTVRQTPYQIQRSQMKQKFQFPNGESFTPRAQLKQKHPSEYDMELGGANRRRSSSLTSVNRRPRTAISALRGSPLSADASIGSSQLPTVVQDARSMDYFTKQYQRWPSRSTSLRAMNEPMGRRHLNMKAVSMESLSSSFINLAGPSNVKCNDESHLTGEPTNKSSVSPSISAGTAVRAISYSTTSSSSFSRSSGSLVRENISSSDTSTSDTVCGSPTEFSSATGGNTKVSLALGETKCNIDDASAPVNSTSHSMDARSVKTTISSRIVAVGTAIPAVATDDRKSAIVADADACSGNVASATITIPSSTVVAHLVASAVPTSEAAVTVTASGNAAKDRKQSPLLQGNRLSRAELSPIQEAQEIPKPDANQKPLKRSNSKLGFLRRFFPPFKRNKKLADPNTGITSLSIAQGKANTTTESIIGTNSISSKIAIEQSASGTLPSKLSKDRTDQRCDNGIDTPDESTDSISASSTEEKEPGSLFDIDLVFDSLLLKSDRHDEPKKEHSTNEVDHETMKADDYAASEISQGTVGSKNKRSSLNYDIDYDLIQDFSKLGKYIDSDFNQEVQLQEESQFQSALTPPPRSVRRPILRGSEVSHSFYSVGDGTTRSDPERKYMEQPKGDKILTNLHTNWKVVHVNASMPRQSSSSCTKKSCQKDQACSRPSSNEDGCSPNESIGSEKSNKRLEFANDIYVNDTYSHLEYRRSDRKFLRERKHLMTSLQGLSFVQSVKWELNDFKRNEMLVHPESKQNTQFFI